MIAEAATAAPSGHWTRISSHSATENLAPTSSARISALIRISMTQPSATSTTITDRASGQCRSA